MSERARSRFHSMYFKFRVQRTFSKKLEAEFLSKEHSLKEDQIKLILQSFSALDENGDGRISKREIARAYKLAGFNPSKTDLDEIVVQHDINDDGYIDFAEYFQAMRIKMISMDFEEERLRTAFRVLDTNQDGFITREELRHAISARGNPLTEKEIDNIIKRADKNHDGKIDYNVKQRRKGTVVNPAINNSWHSDINNDVMYDFKMPDDAVNNYSEEKVQRIVLICRG